MGTEQGTEKVRGNKAPLEGDPRSQKGSRERGCPRWCAPCQGGRSIPVHFPRQSAPPIPLGLDMKESRTREPRGGTKRCFGEAV